MAVIADEAAQNAVEVPPLGFLSAANLTVLVTSAGVSRVALGVVVPQHVPLAVSASVLHRDTGMHRAGRERTKELPTAVGLQWELLEPCT